MKIHILLLSILLLFSCTKFGKTYRVKGKVINPITGEGIAGAHVTLSKFTLGISGGSKTQKRVVTDENGNFDISKLAFRNDGIAVPVLPGNDYEDWYRIGWTRDGGKTIEDFKVPFGKTIHADYYAVPYGYYRRSIINTSCFDDTDSLVITMTYQIPQAFFNNSNTTSVYLGCFQFIATTYTKLPMGWFYFTGYYKKNNIKTTFKDSIYISAGGYHELVFNY